MAEDGLEVVDEVEATVKQAANGQRVIVIRISVGKSVSVPKVKIATELHKRFPGASIEMEEGGEDESVTVKDIEVE